MAQRESLQRNVFHTSFGAFFSMRSIHEIQIANANEPVRSNGECIQADGRLWERAAQKRTVAIHEPWVFTDGRSSCTGRFSGV